MSIKRMGPDEPTVSAILQCQWWPRILQLCIGERLVNVQVREDSLNVYFRMGSVLRISGGPGAIRLEMHKKYVPMHYAHRRDYLHLTAHGSSVNVDAQDPVIPILHDLLADENWQALKQQISLYVTPEQEIHANLMAHNAATVIDTEVQAGGIGRADFLNLDRHSRRIVAIELKRIDDNRLYTSELDEQIEKYVELLTRNPTCLIKACRNTVATKVQLGLIPADSYLHQAFGDGPTIEQRPLLIIACGNQAAIDMLRDKLRRKLDGLRTRLCGVFFFGETVDFNLQAGPNKELF